MVKWGITLCLLLLTGLAKDLVGQTDTSLILSEVVLEGQPLRSKTVGAIQISLSDTFGLQPTSMAQLLEASSNIYVKNYGPGSIASLATRGSAGGHTAVIWNGLSISNPMLGILDFSLLPTAVADDIELQLGSGSSAWGSGAIGGVLSLNNSQVFNEGWHFQINSTIGSFSRTENVATAEWSNDQWSASTTLMHVDSKNDFPLEQAALSGSSVLEHGNVNQSAFIQSLGYKIGDGHMLRLMTWYQESERNIPPTDRQLESVATQSDKALRMMVDYQMPTRTGLFQVKLGHFREALDFLDDLAGVDSKSMFNISQGDAAVSFEEFGISMTASISGMFTSADIINYDNEAEEWRTSFFVSAQRYFGPTAIQLSYRQPWFDGEAGPAIPQLGLSWKMDDHWEVIGRCSRNFRQPTLNDRYWAPGGNADLKQEKGWAQELSLLYEYHSQRYAIKHRLSGFNRSIDDWILWAPIEGNGFWSATNLGQVDSYGIEFHNEHRYKIRGINLMGTLSYTWTQSTNQKPIARPKIEKGQPLFYVPEHSFYTGLSMTLNRWFFQYTHKYTSGVAGINKAIPGFDLGNAAISYKTNFGLLEASLLFRLYNIWDRRYEIVEFRPMPGRNFELVVSLKFNE